MPDRERVINALELCSDLEHYGQNCGKCPYKSKLTNLMCFQLLKDALALLKEQEAVKPVFDDSRPDVIGTFHCGACHSMLGFIHPFYCPHCGRKVKWDA